MNTPDSNAKPAIGPAMSTPIKKGDELEILPEWQDEGDDQFRWFAIEDEDGGRVRIQPQGTGLSIKPNQVVETRMVRRKAQ